MSYLGPTPILTFDGGTGQTTLTNHGVLVGAGAAAITQLAAAATGTVLIGNGSTSDPSFSASPTVSMITILNAPINPTDGVNKAYADSIASGFSYIAPVVVATIGTNLNATYNNGTAGVGATLTNAGTQAAFSLDGVSPTINQRVLVKDQTAQADNGVYQLSTVGSGSTNWVLTRTTDYDTTSQIKPGTIVPVTSGTDNANTSWIENVTVTTIGTNPILFNGFTGTGVSDAITDSGTAVAASGALTFHGGTNINTSGSGSTVTINLNNSPSISGTLTLSGLTQGALVSSSAGVISAVTGTAGYVLTANSGSSAPSFQAPAASSISITGDTGGALVGSAFTISGGSTGLSFGGSGSTETLTFAGITANGGTVSLATDATTSTINIGTGAGAKTSKFGSTNTTSTTTINAGSGGILFASTAGTNLRTISSGYTGSNWITLQSDVQTTNATPTTLISVAVADSQMVSIKAYINGFQSTYANAIGAEVFLTVYFPHSGAATIVGTPVVNTNTTSTCDVTCTVGSGTALIQVTGVAAQTWNWVGTYEYMILASNS